MSLISKKIWAPGPHMLKQRAGRFSSIKAALGLRVCTQIAPENYIVICTYEPHISHNIGPGPQTLKHRAGRYSVNKAATMPSLSLLIALENHTSTYVHEPHKSYILGPRAPNVKTKGRPFFII